MSTSISGVVIAITTEALFVACDDEENRWFSFASDIDEEDRDAAKDFEVNEEVDFSVTDFCAKKYDL
jgi:ribosomal protein S1